MKKQKKKINHSLSNTNNQNDKLRQIKWAVNKIPLLSHRKLHNEINDVDILYIRKIPFNKVNL